jgi:ATP-dependent helicase/nuclease subunit A
LPLQWSVPTPAAAVPAAPSVERVAEEAERPEFDWVGETARHVGTLVHRELERLVKAPLPHVQNWNSKARRAQFDLEIAELGVPEHLRREACERVIAAVQATLSDPRGRWILNFDQTHRDASSEIALSGVDNGQVISIIIDRSFVDGDGTRWIVDFKTSSHEGGGREEFLASEEARYRPQLARYAKLMAAYKPGEPIKTALYFPLLGAWREVEQTPQI